jgi:hypothetical protein
MIVVLVVAVVVEVGEGELREQAVAVEGWRADE